jgi:hypothetical protein
MDRRVHLTAVATETAARTGCAQLAGVPTRLAVPEREPADEPVLYDLGVDGTYS